MVGQEQFDKLADALGSRYAAVRYVSNLARSRSSKSKYHIQESEAITWILTGKEPKYRTRLYMDPIKYDVCILEEILEYIDDRKICESVSSSYEASLEYHHLIYVYQEGLSQSQQARVRILTRMVWYNIEHERGFNSYGTSNNDRR